MTFDIRRVRNDEFKSNKSDEIQSYILSLSFLTIEEDLYFVKTENQN